MTDIKVEEQGEIVYVKNNWGEFPDGIIPDFSRILGNKAILNKSFVFVDKSGRRHEARKYMIYDGGSTPRLTRSVSSGPWDDDIIGSATIHDQYCQDGRAGLSPLKSSDVHRLFYECLKCAGVPEWRARSRYIAVYVAGPRFKAAPSA